jgi:hypothetical protein
MNPEISPNAGSYELAWDLAHIANNAHTVMQVATNNFNHANSCVPSFFDTDTTVSHAVDNVPNLRTQELIVEAVATSIASAETAETLPPITKETIKSELLGFAIIGGNKTVEDINKLRKGKNKVEVLNPEIVEQELDEWLTEEKLTYMNERRKLKPDVIFTLDATPNVLVSGSEVYDLQVAIGKKQGIPAYIWSDILKSCSKAEASGTNPGNGKTTMFSIRENEPTEGMSGTLTEQVVELGVRQEDNPFLRSKTPLEDVTRFNTLYAQSDKPLIGREAYLATAGRYLAVKPKRVGDYLCVPCFCVNGGGKPNVSDSSVVNDDNVSLVVG